MCRHLTHVLGHLALVRPPRQRDNANVWHGRIMRGRVSQDVRQLYKQRWDGMREHTAEGQRWVTRAAALTGAAAAKGDELYTCKYGTLSLLSCFSTFVVLHEHCKRAISLKRDKRKAEVY